MPPWSEWWSCRSWRQQSSLFSSDADVERADVAALDGAGSCACESVDRGRRWGIAARSARCVALKGLLVALRVAAAQVEAEAAAVGAEACVAQRLLEPMRIVRQHLQRVRPCGADDRGDAAVMSEAQLHLDGAEIG